MPRFIYKAKAGPKEIKEGVIEADSQRAAIYKINQMGYFPIEVTAEVLHKASGKGITGMPFLNSYRKISWRQLAVFTRQLADLLTSGLTILKALEVLSRQAQTARFKAVVDDIYGFVKEGGNLSNALARHPEIFSNIYVSMVRSGEAGGMLEEIFNRLADYAETEDQLRTKVQSALAYPILMTLVGAGTIFVLLTFVIPKLITIFEDMGQSLPIPTLILIHISNFFRGYGWLIILALGIAVFLLDRQKKKEAGRLAIDSFKIKLFGFGPLIKKTEIARFTRTLGTLLTNGVPMIQSLEVSSSTVENEVLRRQIKAFSKDVASGASFSNVIMKASLFPLFVRNMIAVGDESGHLEKSLLKVAESCEHDVDRMVRVFTALLEPFIILVMGGIVGFIVISMLLPIFQINLMAR